MKKVIIAVLIFATTQIANATYITSLSWGRYRIGCTLSQRKVFDSHGYYYCIPATHHTPRWRRYYP